MLRFEDLLDGEDAAAGPASACAPCRDPFQVAIFQLSGGTTSVPKIIPRMQNDYLLNAQLTARWLGYRNDDVMFIPMQIAHNAAMICFLLPTLLTGAEFAMPLDMTPAGWGRVFRERRPTWVGLIRALTPRLNAMIDEGHATLERVRAFWALDAARLPHSAWRTRPTRCSACPRHEHVRGRGRPVGRCDTMVGWPLSPFDEVRLVEPGTDREVAEGEPGELTCRGPYTLEWLLRRGRAQSRGLHGRRLLPHLGDPMVRRVINGRSYYAFAGRTKGHRESRHGEDQLRGSRGPGRRASSHRDRAIVGMPDAVLGERACAFLVPAGGRTAPTRPSWASSCAAGASLSRKVAGTHRGRPRARADQGRQARQGRNAPADHRDPAARGRHRRWPCAADPRTPMNADANLRLKGVHHGAPDLKLRETIEFYRDRLGLPLVHCVSAKRWGPSDHPDFCTSSGRRQRRADRILLLPRHDPAGAPRAPCCLRHDATPHRLEGRQPRGTGLAAPARGPGRRDHVPDRARGRRIYLLATRTATSSRSAGTCATSNPSTSATRSSPCASPWSEEARLGYPLRDIESLYRAKGRAVERLLENEP
ncbi:MAG: AMP-binding protein [Steroidobacteraceae bacterium]